MIYEISSELQIKYAAIILKIIVNPTKGNLVERYLQIHNMENIESFPPN